MERNDTVKTTSLHLQSLEGHLLMEIIRQLLDNGDDVNETDNDGRTPLHLAAQKGHLDIVEFLKNNGADVDKTGNNGRTSLHFASTNGHQAVVQYLVENGADINTKDSDGSTPLHWASYSGDLNTVKYLHSVGAGIGNRDNKGRTPFHFAAQKGHLDIVTYLVDNEANIKASSATEGTPLHQASYFGHLAVVEYLVNKGGNVNELDDKGGSPLHLSSRKGHLDVVKYLLDKGADMNKQTRDGSKALHLASRKGHLGIVQYLVEKGADVNDTDNSESTPLHLATSSGHLNIVECLYDAGACIENSDNKGLTSLHKAAQDGNLSIVAYLLDKGADLNKQTSDGSTPLHLACAEGHLDVVQYLFARGTDINERNDDGRTLIHLATESGYLNIVQYLVDKGADVNVTDKEGISPLHCTLLFDEPFDILKCLLDKGADANTPVLSGLTLLHFFSIINNLGCIQYLVEKGADINVTDDNGLSPLCIASLRGSTDIVKFLVSHGADVNYTEFLGLSPLHLASISDSATLVEYFLSEGVDVSSPTNTGLSALHIAADRGHHHLTAMLLRSGADVNQENRRGETPLMLSTKAGHSECVRLLLDSNADVEKVDGEGWTALHYAALSDKEEATQLLVDRKVAVARENSRGQLPLHLAIHAGNTGIARQVLLHMSSFKDLASYINHRDKDGFTPLHLATKRGLTTVIEMLLDSGADLNHQSNDGQTALHLAVRMCCHRNHSAEKTPALGNILKDRLHNELSTDEALVQMLLDQGADINVQDIDGYTAVQYAENEVVRRLMFDRVEDDDVMHEFRTLRKARPLTSKSGRVGFEGGELYIDGCDLRVTIPPGSIEPGTSQHASINIIDDPQDISLQENEFLVAPGVQCSLPELWDPYGALRDYYDDYEEAEIDLPKTYFTMSFPHNASVMKSSECHPDMIVRHSKSTAVTRIDSSNEDNFCVVDETKCKITVSNVNQAELWVPLELHKHTNGKRLKYTPFLPEAVKLDQEIILRVYLHEDLPGVFEGIKADEEVKSYRQIHPSKGFLLEPELCDLFISCADQEKTLPSKGVFDQAKTLISFSLKMSSGVDPKMITLTLRRGGGSEELSMMSFLAICDECDSGQEASTLVPTDPLQVKDAEQDHDDGIIQKMTVPLFYHFGVALGLSYRTLDSIQSEARKTEGSDTDDSVYSSRSQRAANLLIRHWRNKFPTNPTVNRHLLAVWASVNDEEMTETMKGNIDDSVQPDIDSEGEDVVLTGDQEQKAMPKEKYRKRKPTRRGKAQRRRKTKSKLFRPRKMTSQEMLPFIEEISYRMEEIELARMDVSQTYYSMDSDTNRIEEIYRELNVHRVPSTRKEGDTGMNVSQEHNSPDLDTNPLEDVYSELNVYRVPPSREEGDTAIQSIHNISKLPDDTEERHASKPQEHHEEHEESTEVPKVIRLEEHHIEVTIPPVSRSVSQDITVEAITEVPLEMDLPEDEAIISVGLRFSPSGLRFSTPVKVTLPHCAIFSRPAKAHIKMYTRDNTSENFSAVSPSTKIPRCDVRQRDLDVYLTHFSDWWIVARLKTWVDSTFRTNFIGKRLICTPYRPISRPRNTERCIYLCLRDDLNGTTGEKIDNYESAFLGEQYLVRWGCGDLNITYHIDQKEVTNKTLEERMFYNLTSHRIPFVLEPKGIDVSQVRISFVLQQDIKKEIMFHLLFEAEPSCDTCPADLEVVTDKHILNLSKVLHPDNFNALLVALGIEYSIAVGFRRSSHSVSDQFIELLQYWKSQSKRTLRDLDDILVRSELGGLRSRYK